MSAVEDAYARLSSDGERKMWQRAASVAQDERRTEIERCLALDVTTLLVKLGHVREAANLPMAPALSRTDRSS